MKIDILYPSGCELGESPLWHKERMSCFWVDIEGQRIYEYHWMEKTIRQYQLDERVSLVVRGDGDKLILGLQGGIGRFNLVSETMSMITDLCIDWTNYRCNDGGCDSKGRLWVGTMELNHKIEAGSVYCINEQVEFNKKIDKVSISNGMAWSLDNKQLYYIDSLTREIHLYSYDEKTSNISFEKVAVFIPEKAGWPDGMAIDEEGMLWVALWGGFGVGRFDPASGKMIDFIEIPAPHVSNCAFAGEELDSLVITTAREDLTKEDLVNYPGSGNVFIVKPGVRGVPGFCCGL